MIVNRDKATFYLLCLLTPFENTSLASIGGVFTAPLAIITMPLIIWCLSSKVNRLRDYEFRIAKFFFIIFTISFLNLIYLQTKYDFSFLVDRGFRFFLISIPTFLVFIFCARIEIDVFKKGISLLFIVVIASYILNILNPNFINSSSFIQNSHALSPHRMRGFTLEASTFGFQIILAILLFLKSKKITPVIGIIALLVLIAPTTSKGGIIALLVAVTIAALVVSINIKPLLKYLITIIVFLLILILNLDNLILLFSSDIQKYNSVATRGTIVLTGFVSIIKVPFGYGFFGYLPSIYENGPIARDLLENLFPRVLNFSEVNKYFIIGTVEGVGTKTFTLDWFIFGGFYFLYYYYNAIKFLSLRIISDKSFYDLCIFLFLIISTSTYIPADGRYIAPIALAYIFLMYSTANKTEKKHSY